MTLKPKVEGSIPSRPMNEGCCGVVAGPPPAAGSGLVMRFRAGRRPRREVACGVRVAAAAGCGSGSEKPKVCAFTPGRPSVEAALVQALCVPPWRGDDLRVPNMSRGMLVYLARPLGSLPVVAGDGLGSPSSPRW